MDLLGPLTLAQADRQHLEQAALVTARERGVRLDPVEEDDPVGGQGVGVEVDRQAEAVPPEDDRRHLGPDRAADRSFGDAQFGQERPLAGLGPAAVAPHRRHDERAVAQFEQRPHRRAGDGGDPGDPAAPDGQGHRAPGRHPVAKSGSPDRRGHGARDVAIAGWRTTWRTRAIGGKVMESGPAMLSSPANPEAGRADAASVPIPTATGQPGSAGGRPGRRRSPPATRPRGGRGRPAIGSAVVATFSPGETCEPPGAASIVGQLRRTAGSPSG